MSKPLPSGLVPGADRHEQAVRIAGTLAELGIVELRLSRGSEEWTCLARDTDLPGELGRCKPGTLMRTAHGALVFRVGERTISWECADEDLAGKLLRNLEDPAP